MQNNAQNIVVLCRDEQICDTLKKVCLELSSNVEFFTNYAEAIPYACTNSWELILLCPEEDVYSTAEACNKIKSIKPFSQIVIVSATHDPHFTSTCLYNGADDCITMPCDQIELTARIAVAIGRYQRTLQLLTSSIDVKSSNVLEPTPFAEAPAVGASNYRYAGDVRLCGLKREVTVADEHVQLTRTEYQLITYLLERISRPCSSVELLKNVLGYHDENYLPSLHSHISRLRRKLEVSRTTSIETIWCYGYRVLQR